MKVLINMRYINIIFLIITFFCKISVYSDDKNVSIKGYVKLLTGYNTEYKGLDNVVHSRVNTRWYADEEITAGLEMRARVFWGKTVSNFPGFSDFIDENKNYFNLSKSLIDEKGFILHSMIDRLWVDWYKNNMQVRIGRQRINWGSALVWNPNDIFNVYSYYDFDYEERPGADGIRIQYYTGVSTKIEAAFKRGNTKKDRTAALLVKLNKWEYDFKIILGHYKENLCLGAGWEGNLKDGAFRGEITYFNLPEFRNMKKGYITAVLSYDYTLASSLYLHTEILYNENSIPGSAGNLNYNLSADRLSPAEYSIFWEAGYDITPLLRGGSSFILNPDDHSFFVSPSLNWSIKTNFDLLLISQMYHGKNGTEFGSYPDLTFLRFKYSF